MTAQLLTPKMAIAFICLIVLMVWYFFTANSSSQKSMDSELASEMLISNPGENAKESTIKIVDTKSAEMKNNQVKSEGIFFNVDKTHVSIYFQNLQRLMALQRLAEVAAFDFSLPDSAVDFWAEPITVNINDQPIASALSEIIGSKNFTLEMSYDAAIAAHKISAVFLIDNTVQSVVASPVGKHQPLPVERDIADAPTVNFSGNNEQHIKRENFFTADDQARLAILREMSPVGDDLRYIVSSLKHDKNAQVRAQAAQRLSFSENYIATQSLIDALTDQEPEVVRMAVESLVSLGDFSVIAAMDAKLGGSENGKTLVQDAARRIQSRFALATDVTN